MEVDDRLALGYVRTQLATTTHKLWVVWFLLRLCLHLGRRAAVHDLSKYGWVEAEGFAHTIDALKHTTYGTEEYRALLRQIRPSIDHHYAVNTHHPEHWGGRLCDMPLLDRIEMVADWSAAVRRHADGDLGVSIALNARRFDYSPEEAEELRELARAMGSLP